MDVRVLPVLKKNEKEVVSQYTNYVGERVFRKLAYYRSLKATSTA